jgi:hypothetical protein
LSTRGAVDRVLAEPLGGAAQDGHGDRVLTRGRGGEDHLRQRGDLGLVRRHRPFDERLGVVHLEERQHVGAEARPVGVDVGDRDRRLERMHRDITCAAAVADDVSAAADLDRACVAMATEAAGAGAAELQHLGRAVGRPGVRLEGEEQVVADHDRHAGPGRSDGAAQAFAVGVGADAGHADADAVRRGGQPFADGCKQGGEVFGAEEAEVAGADGEGGQFGVVPVGQEGRGAGAAAFDAEDAHGVSGPCRSSRRRSRPWSPRGS